MAVEIGWGYPSKAEKPKKGKPKTKEEAKAEKPKKGKPKTKEEAKPQNEK